jgi:citrate lyase subunit beta/citryl-CoA lyase
VTPTAAGLEFLHARSLLVLACQAAGLPAPVDGPHANLGDERGLAESCRSARALGFGGKVVIHPAQIEPVQEAYTPSADEIARARAVVEAFERARQQGQGVARLADGSLVEKPVVARAVRLLASGGWPTEAS